MEYNYTHKAEQIHVVRRGALGDHAAYLPGLFCQPLVSQLAVNAHEHRGQIGQLFSHDGLGDPQTKRRLLRHPELPAAQIDVFGFILGKSAEIAAVPGEKDRVDTVPEQDIAGRWGQGDVAAEDHLTHLVHEDGAVDVVAASKIGRASCRERV